jgi:hypothetical protein
LANRAGYLANGGKCREFWSSRDWQKFFM